MARQVANPEVHAEQAAEAEERRVLQIDRHRQRQVERVEDRNLRDHRQTPAHRVYLVRAIQLHRLLLQTLRIALVLVSERIDLRLQRLHRLHRAHALDRQRVEQDLRHDGEQDDGDAVVADVSIDPVQQQQDRHAEPFHRQAAVLPGHREPAEVDRFLQAERLQPLVFLRSCIEGDGAFPRLPGRDRGRGPHGDRRATHGRLVAVLRLGDLAFARDHELEPRALRDQRRQIPHAAQGDPFTVRHVFARRTEVLDALDGSVRGPDDFRWMLALELLGHPAPRLSGEPGQDEPDRARRAAGVLDAHNRVDRIAIGIELERRADPEAVRLARQREVGRLVTRHGDGLLVEAHRDDHAGPAAVGRDEQSGRPEIADDNHRLLAPILEDQFLEFPALAAHDVAIERRLHRGQALGGPGLLR